MKLRILCGALASLILLAGCDYDCYEVEIKPEGAAFRRTLTCWHQGGERAEEVQRMDEGKLARIGVLYAKRESPGDAKKQVFSGRFNDKTPADVGGAGSYTHFASALGGASFYVERFRGNDDLNSQLAKRGKAADELVDLLEGWLAAEIGSEANFPKLKQFLDSPLRQDLKNMGIYEWAGSTIEDNQGKVDEEYFFRAGLYLWERGYFHPQEIPALYRSMDNQDYQSILRHVQRLLARKLGVPDDQPVPESLAFLNDMDRLKTSFEKYARTTLWFRQRMDQWKAKADKGVKIPKEPTPGEFVEELLLRGIGESSAFWGQGNDSIKIRLLCGQKPYSTNGTWEKSLSGVTWSWTLKPSRALPAMFFAAWSAPDEKFQEARFGKVLLQDGELAEYVIWRRALKPEEAKEWDGFLDTLKPGPGLKQAVESFRFSTDPKVNVEKANERPPSQADLPRGMILKQLDVKEKEKGGS
jgi:hypothetical protein